MTRASVFSCRPGQHGYVVAALSGELDIASAPAQARPLVDAQHAAERMATHSHLPTDPQLTPDAGRKPASKRIDLTGSKGPGTTRC
jgi:hypothetical protein